MAGSKELSPYRRVELPDPPAFEDFEEDSVHLRDYWRVLVKHRRLILGIFVFIVASTALVTFTAAPHYTATTTIQIEREAPDFAPVQQVQNPEVAAVSDKYDYYQTQYQILESRTVAARVIRALALEDDRRFTEESGSPGFVATIMERLRALLPSSAEEEQAPLGPLGVEPRWIDKYLEMLSINPVRNSRLVDVAFTTKHADLSAEIANRHVEEYTAASLEQRLGMTLKAKGFLEDELGKSRERVVAAEAALNKFRKDHRVVSLDGGPTDVVSERFADLNRRHTEAQADRIRLGGQYRLIQERDYESLPDVLANPLVAELKGELSIIEAERAQLEKKFKPAYPKMRETIAREDEARGRLNSEIGKIVAGIESSYLAAKSREESLAEQLEKQREAALSQKDVSAGFGTLERDVNTARELYANLLQRLKDVDVAEEIKVSNVSVVDGASPPRFPSSPRKLLNLVLATVLGLMLGVGMAFFVEYMDDTVKTPEDAERRLRLPSLGTVPSFDTPVLAYAAYGNGHGKHRRANPVELPATKNGNGNGNENGNRNGSTELIVAAQPWSVVAEAYRTIRTGILLSSADHPPQVILFTSSSSSEGKTVTAVNQAVTLAESGARVLLIDADIRKPRIHKIFHVPNGHGLSTYLTGQTDLKAAVRKIDPNLGNGNAGNGNGESAHEAAASAIGGELYLLPSGPLPPNPAELLGSKKMRETLADLREDFDYIIIDTPPVLPVTDAVVLSTMSDGVVLVVRGQETPTNVVEKARDRLVYARAKLIGIVLNDVDVTSGDYGDYQRYYYSYYASSDRPEA